MSYNTITYDITENIATITLNRPDDANALNAEMAREMRDVSIRCGSDQRVRAVIITATGKMFCAGGDLKEMQAVGEAGHEHLTRMADDLHDSIIRFQYNDAPVVMAVNGTAAGGGFSLMLSGDYILAADRAKFISAYAAAGLTPDGSSTYFLAKHIGLLRAKELVLTNRTLSAEEALAWGLISKVVTDEQLMDEAYTMASTFASGPTKAYGGAKGLLLSAGNAALEQQLDAETRTIADMMRTHDGPEGLAAFVRKQKPQFKGR
ncbi:MAG: enoyl-CoA hydratase/isomerase family protein [Hyphomicrobiaceae bacterium]